ncbi:biotin-dependent carboxyltransferase family protein [Aestuariibaculum sp. YM273]|uniref:5-oxoprolinase subunit C family protein n=1 Tax=Aestuariibaculum sp. YM273 TaxID=3070659 RepID=UPI0027DBD4BC|nr:biotin-dependent carboxyltransferase family protein [Aestuariibaculum sp. YM273]WMI65370.1 biotin-dependent carboxyltransferase family protein [Aestuariibaculum sp. YM273]
MIKVLKQGFYTSIQDFGRFNCQQYGVPYSGVMDRYSAGLANAILGNAPDLAVIEMTVLGPALQFECNTFICVTGADISPKINNENIQKNKPVEINKGDVLSFGRLKKGVRGYLAVLGGILSEEVLGSRSMYKGVTEQGVLLKNDYIEIGVNNLFKANKNSSVKVKVDDFKGGVLEVFKGPEFDLLTPEQQSILTSSKFTISKNNSRMAYQFEESFENNLEPIITSPVLPGTVQLTPSGQLIVLMRDCQTTGGYPRVLQLKESSINCLSQKFTGDKMQFKMLEY